MEKFINTLMMGASGILAIIGLFVSLGVLALLVFIPFLPEIVVSAVGYCVFFILFGVITIILSFLSFRATDAIIFAISFSRFAKKAELDIERFNHSFFKSAFIMRFKYRNLLDEEIHYTVRHPSAFYYKNFIFHGLYDQKELYEVNDDGSQSFIVPDHCIFQHK